MATLPAARDELTEGRASEPIGILGGPASLAAYLAFLGIDSLDELEDEQLTLEVAA
jgi:hypothetical protein